MIYREMSAGGVVVQNASGGWQLAIIRPAGRRVWSLPKGHLDAGETAAEAARREVKEETGLNAEAQAALGEVKYFYRFAGKLTLKRVSFFLFRYLDGLVGSIETSMRSEIAEARWIPAENASGLLAYPGERQMVLKALELLLSASREGNLRQTSPTTPL